MTREQQLEQALQKIYDETSWAVRRRFRAHQAAMQRIRAIIEEVNRT